MTENDYIQKLTVLYVEDDVETLNSLGLILERKVKKII
jgi:hypothetical protein